MEGVNAQAFVDRAHRPDVEKRWACLFCWNGCIDGMEPTFERGSRHENPAQSSEENQETSKDQEASEFQNLNRRCDRQRQQPHLRAASRSFAGDRGPWTTGQAKVR